mgnify:CR=1 FL=1
MRDVINKGLTEDVILRGAGLAFEAGWNRVKLYFMLGLPTETEEDIKGIAYLSEAIAKRYDMGVAVSLMDLSVEAEAFGGAVHFSEDDVPTLHEALIHDEEEADALEVPEVGAGRTGECVKGIKLACEMITDRPVLAGIIGHSESCMIK